MSDSSVPFRVFPWSIAFFRFKRIALALGWLLPAFAAIADGYPAKPVRFVVAFPAGGNADLIGRLVGQNLSEAFGRPFIIDNRGGAAGVIAEEIVARAAPDGYTILLVSLAHVVNPNLTPKLSYDPMRDLAPVSLVTSAPNVLLVHRTLPVQSVPELIAFAKARPGQLNYSSSYGTSLHISGELFKAMTGVDIVNINYKSGGVAVPDIEAGRVQMSFSAISTAVSLARTGRVRGLAVTSEKRSQALPELPAIAEFVPGYAVTGWQGILVPVRTPRALIARLAEELVKIMQRPEVRSRLLGLGVDPVGTTPEAFAAFRKAEFAKLEQLVAKAGLRAEAR